MTIEELLKYIKSGGPLGFYSSAPNVLTPMIFAKMFCAFFTPENPDGIANSYLPHALEWEITHYPVSWSVGN
jgi:hypothetical protein